MSTLATLVSRALLTTALLAPVTARAQAVADTGIARALAGRWACRGAFASGRPIASTLDAAPSLDGRWLEYRQDDVPPGRYHAIGTIGVERTSNLPMMIVHDGGGSVRFFTSATPWRAGDLALETSPADPAAVASTAPARRERFVYTPARDTLRIRYEVSRAPGVWQMGDTLTCTRG